MKGNYFLAPKITLALLLPLLSALPSYSSDHPEVMRKTIEISKMKGWKESKVFEKTDLQNFNDCIDTYFKKRTVYEMRLLKQVLFFCAEKIEEIHGARPENKSLDEVQKKKSSKIFRAFTFELLKDEKCKSNQLKMCQKKDSIFCLRKTVKNCFKQFYESHFD